MNAVTQRELVVSSWILTFLLSFVLRGAEPWGRGLVESAAQCALWVGSPDLTSYPASFPSNLRSWKLLVLLSPESLFNIISFLLTFIKTNIEQRTAYPPTRDTPSRY